MVAGRERSASLQHATGQAQNSAELICGSKNIVAAELRASWPGRWLKYFAAKTEEKSRAQEEIRRAKTYNIRRFHNEL